jgi:hypothetical protein
MITGYQIREFQQQATRRAARERRTPITVFSAESAERDLRSCPNLGTHLARGWKRLVDTYGEPPESYFESVCERVVDSFTGRAISGSRSYAGHSGDDFRFFVDKSGFGDSREPALGLAEVVENLEHALGALGKIDTGRFSLGLGIVEEGQFQCYVGVFLCEQTPTAERKRARAGWRARQKGEA